MNDAQDEEDDISDPEEDTLAGQMAVMRGGKVKKRQEEEESDADDALVLVEELAQDEEDAHAGDGIVSFLGRAADFESPAPAAVVTPQKRAFSAALEDDADADADAIDFLFREGSEKGMLIRTATRTFS